MNGGIDGRGDRMRLLCLKIQQMATRGFFSLPIDLIDPSINVVDGHRDVGDAKCPTSNNPDIRISHLNTSRQSSNGL